MTIEKYTSNEILQILIDGYRFQSVFDPEVDSGEILTFSTTIEEWRRICDLQIPDKLSEYYYEFFSLSNDLNELKAILVDSQNTLQVFCNYIALHAIREKILPIYSLGKKCFEAAIFKKLMAELQRRGVKTYEIEPSSELLPFFERNATVVMEVVSKLSPGTIIDYKYKDSKLSRYASMGTLFSMIVLLTFWAFGTVTMFLWLPFIASVLLVIVGNRLKPEVFTIENYKTFRDLIIAMKLQLDKSSVC